MKEGLARTGIMEDFSPIHRIYFKLDEPVGVGQCTQGSSPGRAAAGVGLGEGRAGGTSGRGRPVRQEGNQEGLMGGVRPGGGRSGRGTPSSPLLKPALTTEPSLCQEHLSTCPQGTPTRPQASREQRRRLLLGQHCVPSRQQETQTEFTDGSDDRHQGPESSNTGKGSCRKGCLTFEIGSPGCQDGRVLQ